MAKKHSGKRGRRAPKTVLRLPDLDQAKSAVLNSLSSADAQRVYRHAIDEFIDCYCSEPRLSFSKTVVLRWSLGIWQPGGSQEDRRPIWELADAGTVAAALERA
ncbi:MAG: hypothetical protein ACREUU_02690 [Gammaproteobacteria bacterium]